MSRQDEKILIEDCLNNSRAAQKALYDAYAGAMYSIVKRYVVNVDEANDILQDSFISVFKYLATYKFEAPLGSWIKRVVINTVFRNKKKKWNSLIEHEDPLQFPEVKLDLSFDDGMDLSYINKKIKELPSGMKEVFLLFFIDEYSHKEIADFLSISEVASRARVFKAREILQKQLIEAGIYSK